MFWPFQIEHLAPRERRSFVELMAEWGVQIERWADAPIAGQIGGSRIMARILKEFKITEISACDRPGASACENAHYEAGNEESTMKTTAAAINAEMDDDAQREIALDRVPKGWPRIFSSAAFFDDEK